MIKILMVVVQYGLRGRQQTRFKFRTGFKIGSNELNMRVGFLKFSHDSETGFYSKLSSGLHSSTPPTREYILYAHPLEYTVQMYTYIQVLPLHPQEGILYTFKHSTQLPPNRVYSTRTFKHSHSTHQKVYSIHSSTPPTREYAFDFHVNILFLVQSDVY